MGVIANTFTAIFVEATIANSDRDKQNMVLGEVSRKKAYIQHVEHLFGHMDSDGSGDISLEEFKTQLHSPYLWHFASSLELEVSEMEAFFNLLSQDGTNEVNIETFVVGCMKLRGTARSMDLLCLSQEHRKLARATMEFFTNAELGMKTIISGLGLKKELDRRKTSQNLRELEKRP